MATLKDIARDLGLSVTQVSRALNGYSDVNADTRDRVMAAARWDLEDFDAAVRESQARRWVVYEALRNGAYYPWDFQPLRAASERFMRNHMDLNVLEENQRFPRGE